MCPYLYPIVPKIPKLIYRICLFFSSFLMRSSLTKEHVTRVIHQINLLPSQQNKNYIHKHIYKIICKRNFQTDWPVFHITQQSNNEQNKKGTVKKSGRIDVRKWVRVNITAHNQNFCFFSLHLFDCTHIISLSRLLVGFFFLFVLLSFCVSFDQFIFVI